MGAFEGRVALITGGARGQGRAHAVAFARAGADVALLDRCADLDGVGYPLATPDDLAETAALVEAEGGRVVATRVDVRDGAALRQAVHDAEASLGPVDVLVANAGISVSTPLGDTSPEVWQTVIDVNLVGVQNSIAAVAPTMCERRYGRIVAVTSMMGRSAAPNIGAYVASKWGVVGLVKATAQDLAGFGVTVNAVAPGTIDTPMVHNDALYRTMRPDLDEPTADDVAPVMAKLHLIPGVPWIDPAEVSRAVLFLADQASGHISGMVLPVDAGASAKTTA